MFVDQDLFKEYYELFSKDYVHTFLNMLWGEKLEKGRFRSVELCVNENCIF